MLHKIISKIIPLLLIMALFSIHVSAVSTDNIEWTLHDNGDCGKSSYSALWKYHTHNQSISDQYYNNRFTLSAGSGTNAGVMENYVYKNYDFYASTVSSGTRKWNSLTSSIYMINIEEGIKYIGDHAFNFGIYYNGISSSIIPYPEDTSSNVRYISLPSTLEEIGFAGFAGALKYVDTLTLPANLSTLDYGVFCGNGFETVVIEEGNLTTIPMYSFANCTSLKEIYIPKTVTNIGSSAFMGCTSLEKIYYGGYSEDWENVTISSGNDALLSAQISFPIKVHVSSVSLNTTSKTLMVGNTYQLAATVLPSNADITDVTWTSSKPSVATVSDNGLVSAISSGTTIITATSVEGDIKATCTVSVQAVNIEVTGVSLNKTSATLTVGGTETLTATVAPNNATNKNVSWTSSNTNVVTVSNGVITAKAVGTATITVTTADGNKTATCAVTVNAATVSVTGVSLNKTSTTLTVGDTETLTATVLPDNATNKAVTWSSSNTDVAIVEDGVVTTKAAGTATITVTTTDGNNIATCVVAVNAVDEDVPSLKINNITVTPGEEFYVDIVAENSDSVKAITVNNIEYSESLTLTNAEWLLTGSTLSSIDINGDSLIAFQNAVDSNKAVMRLYFTVDSNATDGDAYIRYNALGTDSLNKIFDFVEHEGVVIIRSFIIGDCDGDEVITVDDAIYLAFHTFYQDRYPIPTGMNVDFDKDGTVTIDDAIYLAFHTFYQDRYPLD